ncbi:heparan-alpha-glucosaminide N-acetyltransferase [Silicimonas sp. MF1-12-2]|uniref:heparan-alpha-glucosaminide N-acetyltransferase n=1 Tax=Silicimonas sp. MF1-12-2 TaxID=3384793 RepID=UPI0039B497CE
MYSSPDTEFLSSRNSEAAAGRIVAVDIARTLAILGMVVFHFVRDLELFGLIEPGTTLTGSWAVFARLVAGSFLFLVGVSLVLAHGDGIRWNSFIRRSLILLAAALAVSVATLVSVPHRFIYFGILHAILVSSLLGLLLADRPAWMSIVAGLGVVAVWAVWARGVDLPPWMGWTGLAASPRPALDLIPLVPWLAPTLFGIAFAKVLGVVRWRAVSRPIESKLGWPGRHSLAIYLLHQPVIIGLIWVFLRIP